MRLRIRSSAWRLVRPDGEVNISVLRLFGKLGPFLGQDRADVRRRDPGGSQLGLARLPEEIERPPDAGHEAANFFCGNDQCRGSGG